MKMNYSPGYLKVKGAPGSDSKESGPRSKVSSITKGEGRGGSWNGVPDSRPGSSDRSQSAK